MCYPISMIITKNNILYSLKSDSHEEIVKENNLKDDTKNPQFVRVEITPQDKDLFNHDLKNWKGQLDQDLIPDWFKGIEHYEKSLKQILKDIIFKERFIIDQKNIEVVGKSVWIKNSKGITLRNSSAELWESSSAVLWESSSAVLRGSSSAVLRGSSSKIKKMEGCSVCIDRSGSANKIIVANPKDTFEIFKK